MSTALRPTMDLDAFLARENPRLLRCGFDAFVPVAMTGRSVGPAILQPGLAVARTTRLHGQPWPARDGECDATAAGAIWALPPAFHEGTAWTRPDMAASPS